MEKDTLTFAFDTETFIRFVRARNKAAFKEDETFVFEGCQFQVELADRLIEFLATQFQGVQVKKNYISKN